MLIPAPRQISANPLGLNIDFLFGRGYLWARHERVADWITINALRMEIPDLKFPFDARGGMSRFQTTRCLVRELEVSLSEVGLQELMARAAAELRGFEQLNVRLVQDAVHVDARVQAFGAQTAISFKIALIPPEPAHDDELHLSLYDYRAYGPLPAPARLLAFELVTRLLGTKALRPPGRGAAFTIGVAGDILRVRPLKLLMLSVFPRVGWKLPSLAGVVLDEARVAPGQIRLRAVSRDGSWYSKSAGSERGDAPYQLAATPEGARALAAYEAKDLFEHIDQAIFDGEPEQARNLLATYRDVYGLHPELVERSLDLLIADPSPTNLAEAEALCREVERDVPNQLHVKLARPTLARLQQADDAAVLRALDELAVTLRDRQELYDWIVCVDTAVSLVTTTPEDAVTRLREVVQLAPRNIPALERLAELYQRLGRWDDYEDTLKRLSTIYTGREALLRLYLALARHLMERRSQVTEARIYLEKVLRLEPDALDALHMLGESYALSGQPLRALKAFSSAARAAEDHGAPAEAAAIHLRISRLWSDQLENPAEALLSCRRAIELRRNLDDGERSDEVGEADDALIDLYEHAADLAIRRERWDEALRHALEVTPRLERKLAGIHDEAPPQDWMKDALVRLNAPPVSIPLSPERQQVQSRLARAHERLAMLYERRQRPDAAAPHWKKVLSLRPDDFAASERLETILIQGGSPEELISFYRSLITREREPARKLTYHLKLARLYDTLHLTEEAREQLQEALRLDPDSATARARLTDMLRAAGRFETLRDALSTLLLRVQDVAVRHDVLVTLGQLHLRALEQPRQAARCYFEALDLKPQDLDTLRGAHDALEQILELEGHDAPAPIGHGRAGALMLRVLLKLAEQTEDTLDQVHLLERLSILAREQGNNGLANESAHRAATLRDRFDEARERRDARVNRRLDELLQLHPDNERDAHLPLAGFGARSFADLSDRDLPDLPAAGFGAPVAPEVSDTATTSELERQSLATTSEQHTARRGAPVTPYHDDATTQRRSGLITNELPTLLDDEPIRPAGRRGREPIMPQTARERGGEQGFARSDARERQSMRRTQQVTPLPSDLSLGEEPSAPTRAVPSDTDELFGRVDSSMRPNLATLPFVFDDDEPLPEARPDSFDGLELDWGMDLSSVAELEDEEERLAIGDAADAALEVEEDLRTTAEMTIDDFARLRQMRDASREDRSRGLEEQLTGREVDTFDGEDEPLPRRPSSLFHRAEATTRPGDAPEPSADATSARDDEEAQGQQAPASGLAAFRAGFRDIWKTPSSLGNGDGAASSITRLLRPEGEASADTGENPAVESNPTLSFSFGRRPSEGLGAASETSEPSVAAVRDPAEPRRSVRTLGWKPRDYGSTEDGDGEVRAEAEEGSTPGADHEQAAGPGEDGRDEPGAVPDLSSLPSGPEDDGEDRAVFHLERPIEDTSRGVTTRPFDVRHLLSTLARKNEERAEQVRASREDQAQDEHEDAESYSLDELSAAFDATKLSAHRTTVSSPSLQLKLTIQEAMGRADQARAEEDERALIAALTDALALHDDPEHPEMMPEQRALAIARELGETLYFDLEDAEHALPHLERVREGDPEGMGSAPSLLTALESIYEERGETDEQIRLLEARLARSDSADMVNTYRLLLAQLHWDRRNDHEASARLLRPILDEDPSHDAANRLLAQIARERGEFVSAAEHIERVLSQRNGGLDEVELERELADLYLHLLHDPGRAQVHYQGVLDESPADAQAIEGIKKCQAQREDWSGYIESLGRELGLLCAKTSPMPLMEPDALADLRVPEPLRMAASQIVSDAARVAAEHMARLDIAWGLWGDAFRLWNEHAEALEQRVTLGRELGKGVELVTDLESLSMLLLDPVERFETLREAAWICHGLGDDEQAVSLYTQALEIGGTALSDEQLARADRDIQEFSGA